MGIFSDIKDAILGTKPKTTQFDLSLFTPEQQELFSSTLLPLLRDAGPEDQGVPGKGALESTSLAGLEQLAKDLVSGTGVEGTARRQASTSLSDILTRGPQDFADFFETTIRQPALRDFEEETLPRIGRQFGGNQFFSTERQQADRDAREDLLTSLTRSRSGLAFESRQQDVENQLAAAGLTGQVGIGGDLIRMLSAGGLDRNIELTRLGRKDIRVEQLLQALGLQAKENVIVAQGGSTGLLSDLIKGAAAGYTGGLFAGGKA